MMMIFFVVISSSLMLSLADPLDGLMALYDSWHATSVTVANWTSPEMPCSWPGVTCGAPGAAILELNLKDAGIAGSIPTEIGLLTDLESLHLQLNGLTSSIPTELASLVALRDLRLQTNQLTGPLPSQLAALQNLTEVRVQQNDLCGDLPIFSAAVYFSYLGNAIGTECCAAYDPFRYSCAPSPAPTANIACSTARCSDLGWNRGLNSDVCGESDGAPLSGCSGVMRWEVGRAFCQAVGARLCTVSELAEEHIAAGTGCGGAGNPNLDEEYVWSASRCEEDGNSFTIVKLGSTPPFEAQLGCSTHTLQHYARCCADESCTAAPSASAVPSLSPTASLLPSSIPTSPPSTSRPSPVPSPNPTTTAPPTSRPSQPPTMPPSEHPTLSRAPSSSPTISHAPSPSPTVLPSSSYPTDSPTLVPTFTVRPTTPPSLQPTDSPTWSPTHAPTRLLDTQAARGRWSAIRDGMGASGLWGVNSDAALSAEPINLWAFDRDDCRNGRSFANIGGAAESGFSVSAAVMKSSLGALNGTSDKTTACLDGNGIRVLPNLPASSGVVLESDRTVAGLARLNGNDDEEEEEEEEEDSGPLQGLTLELWGDFGVTDAKSSNTQVVRPLLFLGGQGDEQGTSSFGDACDADPWFDVGLLLRQNPAQELQVTVPDFSVDDEGECLRLPPDGFSGLPHIPLRQESSSFSAATSSIRHVVATFNGSAAALYIDGDLRRSDDDFFGNAQPLLNRWQHFGSTNKLQLLSAASVLDIAPFPASLYLVAIWGLALPPGAVRQNFEAGLPNSRPIARDINATIHEDGEHPRCGGVGRPFSATVPPSYDLSPSAGRAGIEAFRRDFEPVAALATIELFVFDQDNDPNFRPNYRRNLAEQYPTRCVIISLPELGTLYQTTGLREAIEEGFTEVRANANGSFIVHYRPPKDAYSGFADGADSRAPFDRFLYGAQDGVTGKMSSEAGVAKLYVVPCNDPPIALNGSTNALSATITAIPLNGTDIDGRDSTEITAVFITSLPSAVGGELLRWAGTHYANVTEIPHRTNFGSAAQENCPDAGVQQSAGWVNGDEYVGCLAYRYEGSESLPLLDDDGTLLVDILQFIVQDVHGANSTPATVAIAVRLPLAAVSSASDGEKHTVFEAVHGNVTLGGIADMSDRRRPVVARITRLPSYGQLFDPVDFRTPLKNGSRIITPSFAPYEVPVVLYYRGNGNFFTTPGVKYDGSALHFNLSETGADNGADSLSSTGHAADSFSFRTELLGDSSVRSKSVEQPVVVVNVNDAPFLRRPSTETFSVLAIGTTGSSDDGGNGDSGLLVRRTTSSSSDGCSTEDSGLFPCPNQPTPQPSRYGTDEDPKSDEDKLIINGISLSDADRDVDPVKVRIACKYGFITLRRSALRLLDFNSFDTCYGHDDWSCRGDGINDREMVFIGQPSDVSNAISHLSYQSAYSFVVDTLSVRVADGGRRGPPETETAVDDKAAIDCLDEADFTTASFRGDPAAPVCFWSTFNLTIRVGKVAGSDETTQDETIEDNRQLGAAFVIFVVMVMLCLCRICASKMCGWKLVAIPSEWTDDDDSNSSSDEDGDTYWSTTDMENEGGSLLKLNSGEGVSVLRHGALDDLSLGTKRRIDSDRKKKNQSRDAAARTFQSETKSFLYHAKRGEAGRNITGEPLAQLKNLRDSIAEATLMDSTKERRKATGASPSFRFAPLEWRKFKDKEGHWFFVHCKTGVKSYAMPWVLRGEDRDERLHEANEPKNWCKIDTGHVTDDGVPVVLWANRVTKQSTFDTPMFASWTGSGNSRNKDGAV